MVVVHKDCPQDGCDICQGDWPCAKLVAEQAQGDDKLKIRQIVRAVLDAMDHEKEKQ